MSRSQPHRGEGLGASWLVLALAVLFCAGIFSIWRGAPPNPVIFGTVEPAGGYPASRPMASQSSVDNSEEGQLIRVLVGGDVLLGLEPGRILAAEGPTALMRGWINLRRAPGVDLGLANLECALSYGGTALAGKRFAFRGDPVRGAAALHWAGLDGVSVANNHILDFGVEAMFDTLQALHDAGVQWAGAGACDETAYAPSWFVRNGARIAFLAFTDIDYLALAHRAIWAAGPLMAGVAPIAPQAKALNAISAARTQADLVVVSFHWGVEYGEVTQAQQRLGRAAIDAGADLVFGHHPHVPQPVEIYQGRPILYSLGNLVFHPFQPAARQMLAGLVTFELLEGSGSYSLIEVELYPLSNDVGKTVTTPEGEAATFLANMANRCRAYGAEWEVLPDRLRFVAQ